MNIRANADLVALSREGVPAAAGFRRPISGEGFLVGFVVGVSCDSGKRVRSSRGLMGM